MRWKDRTIPWTKTVATGFERVLALILLVGVLLFALHSMAELASMNWRLTKTFYELIYRILILVIGIELVRTLITHDLSTVLELLAFVIARKLLKPDLETVDVLLGVAAFVGLLAARRFFVAIPCEPCQAGIDPVPGSDPGADPADADGHRRQSGSLFP